jgi:hypothetical protein
MAGSRPLHADVLTAIGGRAVVAKYFVDLVLATPVYLTSHTREVDWDGNSYLRSGDLVAFSLVNETPALRVGSSTLTLSGVPTTWRQQFLTGGYIDRQVIRRLAFFDSDDALIGDPVIIEDYRIRDFNVNDGMETATVTLELASHWADWDKTAGRRTNIHSQQRHFENDTGMRFAAEAVKEVLWGRS